MGDTNSKVSNSSSISCLRMWTTTTAFKDYTRVEGHFISSEGALHWETRSIAGSKTEITLFWISPTHTKKSKICIFQSLTLKTSKLILKDYIIFPFNYSMYVHGLVSRLNCNLTPSNLKTFFPPILLHELTNLFL